MNYPGTRYTKQMMETVVTGNGRSGAGAAVARRIRGAKKPAAGRGQQLGHLDLLVHMGEEQNFVYQIWPQQYSVPGFTYRAAAVNRLLPAGNLPVRRQPGQRPDGLGKEQVITDILDQYERHLNFIHLHREAPGHSVMFPDA
ncbi:hypothetical protein ACLK2F_01865 [Escherichia coli]